MQKLQKKSICWQILGMNVMSWRVGIIHWFAITATQVAWIFMSPKDMWPARDQNVLLLKVPFLVVLNKKNLKIAFCPIFFFIEFGIKWPYLVVLCWKVNSLKKPGTFLINLEIRKYRQWHHSHVIKATALTHSLLEILPKNAFWS